MEQVFQLSSLLVMPFWLLMVFLPHWGWSRRIVASPAIALPAAILYAMLFLPRAAELFPLLLNPTLVEISAILGTPAGATIGWVHFLAFDLFVGRWIYLDARERGTTAWLISPLLILTLLAGPLGFALYMAIRVVTMRQRDGSLDQPADARPIAS